MYIYIYIPLFSCRCFSHGTHITGLLRKAWGAQALAEVLYLAISFPMKLAVHGGCLPSGKHTKNYGKPPVLMGKLTISMAIFNSELLNYQRVLPLSEAIHLSGWKNGDCNKTSGFLWFWLGGSSIQKNSDSSCWCLHVAIGHSIGSAKPDGHPAVNWRGYGKSLFVIGKSTINGPSIP